MKGLLWQWLHTLHPQFFYIRNYKKKNNLTLIVKMKVILSQRNFMKTFPELITLYEEKKCLNN